MPRHPTLTEAQYNEQWIARIKARCVITDSGCWLWTGTKAYNGYGLSTYRSNGCPIHRKMYEVANGKTLDRWIYACHKCDQRECCNPDHVFEGTPKDNQQDMARKGRADGQWKTHCNQGHEFTPENTKRYPSTGRRSCVACERIRGRMRAGWTREQAVSLPTTRPGYRPVNGTFHPKRTELR